MQPETFCGSLTACSAPHRRRQQVCASEENRVVAVERRPGARPKPRLVQARRIGTTFGATGAFIAARAVMCSVWSDGNKWL